MSFVVVDILKDVVSQVSNDLTPRFKTIDNKITGVHYLHGHPKEIIETLIQRDNSNKFMFDKYPLVALFQDFPEDDLGGGIIEVRLHIVICKSTVATYKAPERYTNNFKPFLYPIYERLIYRLESHPNFLGYSAKKNTKYDRLYWGKQGLYGGEANVFQDFLDAIEIINLTIKFNTSCQILTR